jgi:ATP diphosphatase
MMTPSRDISRLLEIMAMLRTPGSGCPWDLEQTFSTIAPYTIEEAYEVADAITRGDLDDLRDELGDLLLQVVFHARMAEEQNAFAFGDVVEAITRKMIRRHPHVFADQDGQLTPADVKGAWDRIKAEEKAERAARRPPPEAKYNSPLSSVKTGQPALARAMELQRKASSVGFDWNDPRAVLHKIREEADEVETALDRGDAEALAEETGDLLFALVNLARHIGADPEHALRGTNAKFERRFGYIERALAAQGRSLENAALAEMDALWNEAKEKENKYPRVVMPGLEPGIHVFPRLGKKAWMDGTSPAPTAEILKQYHTACGTASKRLTTMSRLVSSTRTVIS